MITQELLVEKIVAHLNGKLTEADLVHWAEDALVLLSESDKDSPNEDALLEVLMYIGAGDTPGFPLSWSVLSGFLAQFGVRVHVTAEAA
jgi:hypothetical protein